MIEQLKDDFTLELQAIFSEAKVTGCVTIDQTRPTVQNVSETAREVTATSENFRLRRWGSPPSAAAATRWS